MRSPSLDARASSTGAPRQLRRDVVIQSYHAAQGECSETSEQNAATMQRMGSEMQNAAVLSGVIEEREVGHTLPCVQARAQERW
eukprot:scaffold33892_cov45-Tisochrysis_lutea.AAC.2